MLKHILLGFLNYGPMTGYELKSSMDESTMHFWHAYHSQIYTALRSLEDNGLVISAVEDADDTLKRRVYTLTESGRVELQRWLDTCMVERSAVKEELLVRVFFSAERDKQDVIDELRLQRQLHQQQLEHYQVLEKEPFRSVPPEEIERLAHHGPFWTATLRFGIAYEKSYLNWLDDTIRVLEQLDSP
jgi:DNA-binding PadR family transcriptional regulator